MKKQFVLIAAAVAALFAISCVKETPVENAPVQGAMKEVTITATIDEATKTSYDADGVFSWTKGDKVSVLASDNLFYTFTAKTSGASTELVGQIPENSEVGNFALYPADENHTYDVNDYHPYRFMIPSYKDMTKNPSADLPMHAEKAGDGTFPFKHMTGGFKFTIDNIGDAFKTAEISIVTTGLQISGLYQARKSGTHSGYVTYAATTENADDLTYVRKVNVVNNSAEIYFPYSPGNDLWGTTTISVVGYDAQNNPTQLISKSASFGGKAHARATIIPVAPIEVSDIHSIDWDAQNVTVAENITGATDFRAVVKGNTLYARMCAPTSLGGDKFYCYVGQGEGDVAASSWAWSSSPTFESVQSPEILVANVLSKVVGENTYWYLEFPLSGVESLTNVYLGVMLYSGTSSVCAAPSTNQSMLAVPLN